MHQSKTTHQLLTQHEITTKWITHRDSILTVLRFMCVGWIYLFMSAFSVILCVK